MMSLSVVMIISCELELLGQKGVHDCGGALAFDIEIGVFEM
jgi:hypothetical protein